MKKYVEKCLKTSVKILNFNLKTITTEKSNNDILDTVSSINEISLDIPAAQIQNPNAEIPNAEIPNPKSQIIISIFCRNPKSQIPNPKYYDLNYAGDVSFHSEEFENFDKILSESLQNYTEKSDTNMSNTLEEFELKSLTLQDNIEESEVEIKEFLNEAYADLITLVTKHNLSNKAENSIIKFFNRHSDLS
ncbi:hypothetical protein Glove_428g2 [Diversispora epigaea]|uniref:Uncharacterized protein n=1 Tax=Diversispora epigaea TaxID=1348612 RepID=A0A397GTH3_9GLOM|nr:hypothetical protein Glove_428g2 [Diversispora epigaea]